MDKKSVLQEIDIETRTGLNYFLAPHNKTKKTQEEIINKFEEVEQMLRKG